MNKQASLRDATTHTAEVSGLKRRLERAEEELGPAQKQLEDSQGMSYNWHVHLIRMSGLCGLKCHELY